MATGGPVNARKCHECDLLTEVKRGGGSKWGIKGGKLWLTRGERGVGAARAHLNACE